ncbi:MAG: DsbA family protein [Candidatus Binatia bacterium]
MPVTIVHYFDYKSPYAYLAQAATDALEVSFKLSISRIPYTLHIPSFLGAAELDDAGVDIVGTRNAHQWRRVKYSYMDCRREANRRGLTIRGPRKIWDSRLAHIGFLYAADHGDFRRYHGLVYERFWRRELDIEDLVVISALLKEAGIETSEFAAFVANVGYSQLATLQSRAEESGVFGVPSWTVDGELFWGSERLCVIEEAIASRDTLSVR